jgi:hypothetical protein
MKEKALLATIVSAKDPREKHQAADILTQRLSNGHNTSLGTLDMLDRALKMDIWRAVNDESLQYKMQTIAILVDTRKVWRYWEKRGKPKSMDNIESRARRSESGSWNSSGRLRMG